MHPRHGSVVQEAQQHERARQETETTGPRRCSITGNEEVDRGGEAEAARREVEEEEGGTGGGVGVEVRFLPNGGWLEAGRLADAASAAASMEKGRRGRGGGGRRGGGVRWGRRVRSQASLRSYSVARFFFSR